MEQMQEWGAFSDENPVAVVLAGEPVRFFRVSSETEMASEPFGTLLGKTAGGG
jgi:hypothetical protein